MVYEVLIRRRIPMFRPILVAIACHAISAAASKTGDAVTFHKDVAPVLQRRCQNCHRAGEIGPMPLLTYRDARPWAKAIAEAAATRKMPPWFADPAHGKFSNDRSLSASEIGTLVSW